MAALPVQVASVVVPAFTVVGPVVLETAVMASLAPAWTVMGGVTVVGIATWKVVAWWKASAAAAAATVAAVAKAAVEAAAVEAAAAAKAAAEAVATQAAEAAADKVVASVAASTSIPVAVAIAVVAVAALGGSHYLYSQYKTRNAASDAPSNSRKDTNKKQNECGDKDKDGGKGKGKDRNKGLRDKKLKPIISKNQMKKLLKKYGKEMYDKLEALFEKKEGTIWERDDFRIDAVPTKNQSKGKNWNLQVNSNSESLMAKKLEEKVGTHAKLFRDRFNLDDTPDYKTWRDSILGRYS